METWAPRGHWQVSFMVSFMELALDFETIVGRPLPQELQAKYYGLEMSKSTAGCSG